MGMPFQPLPCDGGGGAEAAVDVEGTLVCDVNAAGEVVGTALVEAVYDDAGVRTGTRLVNVLDGTVYVPVGTVQPCREGCCPEPVVLCDVQPDGSSVQFIRAYTGDETGAVEAADTTLDGAPYAPTGTVGSCDPYRLCTPNSDVDLNGDCGPGEAADPLIIAGEGVSTDSIVTDDPTADPLCGGVWNRPSQPSPFEVEESFRNATFDQPGPVIQGSAPYSGLTANPAFTGSNAGDTPGQGWLQTSDINSNTNGIWQVPNPFTTADGMTASVTFASHDGTAQGGDGMAFVFTDGSGPAQGSAIGGLGNLGLQNWQNGYVAVVLDEYGQTCSCNQEPPGPNSGAAGGCGFCTNHISIQLAGAARIGATCACCTIARANVGPKTFNSTTRGAPARLIVSIIEELGQTYVSASILWPGDTDPTVYFNRVNVTACAGPSPASLRMALYGGSGGGLRSEHEFRDAVARAAGIQDWRAFPVVTDPIPACVTSVRVEACVDVTFTEDTQDVGNGDPEAFLWLVNSATGNVLDKAEISSLPSTVGDVRNICVDAVVPVADVPSLRVYVGAETRDANGAYGSVWENLEITAAGLGCPVTPVRTLAISAPCPIDVNIVGGTADGTPAPVTVVNTPSTFEDAPVCIDVGSNTFNGFRREVRAPDGTITIAFLGNDGIPVVPDEWRPGECPQGDTELLEICDLGTDPPTPFVRRVTYDGVGEVASAEDVNYVGTPYVPVGPVGRCAGQISVEVDQTLGPVCYNTIPPLPASTQGFLTLDENDVPVLYDLLGNVVPAGTYTIVFCAEEARTAIVLCDQGNNNQPFVRSFIGSPVVTDSGILSADDVDLDGNVYVPVGPVGVCEDADREVVCWTQTSTGDQLHTGTIRHDDSLPAPGWILFDQNLTPVSPAEPGLTFVPCTECCPVVVGDGCWETTDPAATGRYTALRMPDGTILLVDQVDGHTVAPADVVACPQDCTNATTLLVCDIPPGDPDGTPTATDSATQYIADTANADFVQRPGGGAALWSGGAINFGPDVSTGPGITQVHRFVAGTLQATPPTCTDGTVHLSLSVEAQNLGPGAACSGAGRFRLFRVSDGAVLSAGTPLFGTPVGDTEVLIIEADIPAADLTAGNVAVWLDVETFQTGAPCVPPDGRQWQARNFTASYVYGTEGCETQFFRTILTDCETGETIATVDTTPDGAPYVVAGDVGQCSTSSGSTGSSCPCVSAAEIGQAVADAAECCPFTVAEVCLANGNPGVIIRNPDGSLTRVDTITGLTFADADVVDCAPVVNAQARLLAASQAWTPGTDVVGTLTGVSVTGLTGTYTVVDQSGTSVGPLPAGTTLTWSNEQEGTLQGPQSITTAAASTAVVTWTQR